MKCFDYQIFYSLRLVISSPLCMWQKKKKISFLSLNTHYLNTLSSQFTCCSVERIFAIIVLIFLLSTPWSLAENLTPTNASAKNPWNLNLQGKARPQNARTIIDAQEGAWFDDASNTIEYRGNVIVHDSQFTLFCDQLNIVMEKNRQGLQQATARGNVFIEETTTNQHGEMTKSVARAGEAVYQPQTGEVTLKSWPQIQQGQNYQVATEEGTVMILSTKGTSQTIGKSRAMVLETNPEK